MRVAISSAHGLKVRGAAGIIDEVDNSRLVVEEVAEHLEDVSVFHDDVSETVEQNLNRIITWHNSQLRDIDVSIHFNALDGVTTDEPRGVEVFYVTQKELAEKVAKAISVVGLKNRGAKQSTNLAFLNGTDEPAILIEVCFVDSAPDVEIYEEHFNAICRLIALELEGDKIA